MVKEQKEQSCFGGEVVQAGKRLGLEGIANSVQERVFLHKKRWDRWQCVLLIATSTAMVTAVPVL